MALVGKWFGFGRNEHYDSGIRAYERGDLDEAIEQFRICMASEPDPPIRQRAKTYLSAAYSQQGQLFLKGRKVDEAAKCFQDALALCPEYADIRLGLALAHRAADRGPEAMESVSNALAINPRYGMALILRAVLRSEAGDVDGALLDLGDAAAADPRLEGPDLEAGRKALEAGNVKSAVAKLLKIQPPKETDANALKGAGEALAKQNRWHDAEEQFRKALEVAPRYADIRCRHAESLLEIGEVLPAIAEFREALAINPNYVEAQALLAVSLRRAGQEEEAIQEFKRTLELDPHNPIASQELLRRVF